MNKKVLFVASIYSHLLHFHTPFIQMLQQKGYEIHAAGFRRGRPELEALGVTCWDVPFTRHPLSLRNIGACLKLRSILRNNYALIHVHTPVASFLTRCMVKMTPKSKVLYTVHGFHYYQGAPIHSKLFYLIEKIAAKWTSGIVVMNEEDLQSAQALGFIEGSNLFRVHGVGVDPDYYSVESSQVRQELGIPEQALVVTCVAELTANKNHLMLFEAWKLIHAALPNAYLLVVGTGVMAAQLQEHCQKEDLANVMFLGPRRDVPSILHASDMVTLTSKREGLPRCIMEAMAAGKPVVATRIRGNTELVVDGETGRLVELGDSEQLADAITFILRSPMLMSKMGALGRDRVLKLYSIRNVLKEMETIYDKYLT